MAARLPGLAVARVLTAPPAVLAQRDALGVVALGLVGLVVAPLALLAGEGDTDAHISAGHRDGAPSARLRKTTRRGQVGSRMVQGYPPAQLFDSITRTPRTAPPTHTRAPASASAAYIDAATLWPSRRASGARAAPRMANEPATTSAMPAASDAQMTIRRSCQSTIVA